MHTWIGSPEEIITGQEAATLLAFKNDANYYDSNTGITKVSPKRWYQAQQFESRGWLVCWTDQTTDRNHEHHALFNGYQALPPNLGRVLEIGCGPFTQFQTIINGRTATSITLLDPLLKLYKQLSACPYKTGTFGTFPTTLLPIMAEDINHHAAFDTIICINVIEHVMDAERVFTKIVQAIKPNGILVMGERTYDTYDPLKLFDVGHPIRVKSIVLDKLRSKFSTILYQNGDYFIGQKH